DVGGARDAGGAIWVGATGAGAGAGFCGAAGAVLGCAAPASLTSKLKMAAPSETLSPVLIFNSLTTPANGAGTSMVALSDSSVISESSALTLSPGLTRTSMTGMFLKSPMSGTRTSLRLPMFYLLNSDEGEWYFVNA